MWFWNINGYAGAEADVLSFLSCEHADVLVLVDSQLTDTERIKRSLRGWKLLHLSRPHGAHKRRLFGGITVLWKSENCRVVKEGACQKGAISFVVQDAAGLRRPVPVIALYSPPLSSRLNRNGKQWSLDILDWVALEVGRLWQKFGFVEVGGDYNWRIGTTFRRRTEDAVNDSSGRTALARTWHQQTGLRPLYGQKEQPRGVFTSRTENGMAEVDGVSVCGKMPEGWSARALQVPDWEKYSSRGGVHRPVGATVLAPTVDGAQAQTSDRRGDGQTRATGALPRPPSPLAYGSAQYHAMSKAVLECVRQAADRLASGASDTAGALSAVAEGLVSIQTEFFSPQRQRGGNRGVRVKTLTPATLRHRKPQGPFRRLASGMHVPPAVAAQLETHRRLVSDSCRAKQELKRAGRTIDAETRLQLERRAAEANAQAATVLRKAREMLHKHHDGSQEAEAEGLAHMAFSNSHRFFRTLSRKIPEQYGVYDDSAGPSAEKCAMFRDFFAELLAKLRGDGGGGSQTKWLKNTLPTSLLRTQRLMRCLRPS